MSRIFRGINLSWNKYTLLYTEIRRQIPLIMCKDIPWKAFLIFLPELGCLPSLPGTWWCRTRPASLPRRSQRRAAPSTSAGRHHRSDSRTACTCPAVAVTREKVGVIVGRCVSGQEGWEEWHRCWKSNEQSKLHCKQGQTESNRTKQNQI